MTFEKTAISCWPWKNSCEKSRRPFGWAAVIFYQKTVKGTHISSTIIPMRPSRGRGAAWGGRGASTTMRTETHAHQSTAHPPDKACGALARGEGRGAEEAVASGRRERRKKKNTNRYLHNQWQVGNLYAQKPVKVEESAFGSVLVKRWL